MKEYDLKIWDLIDRDQAIEVLQEKFGPDDLVESFIDTMAALPIRITSEQLEKMVNRTVECLEQPIPDSVLEAWKQEVRALLILALSVQGEVV